MLKKGLTNEGFEKSEISCSFAMFRSFAIWHQSRGVSAMYHHQTTHSCGRDKLTYRRDGTAGARTFKFLMSWQGTKEGKIGLEYYILQEKNWQMDVKGSVRDCI